MIFLHIAIPKTNIRCIDARTILFCHKIIKDAKNEKMRKKHWTSLRIDGKIVNRYDVNFA